MWPLPHVSQTIAASRGGPFPQCNLAFCFAAPENSLHGLAVMHTLKDVHLAQGSRLHTQHVPEAVLQACCHVLPLRTVQLTWKIAGLFPMCLISYRKNRREGRICPDCEMLNVTLVSSVLMGNTVEMLGYWRCTPKSLGPLVSVQERVVHVDKAVDSDEGNVDRSIDCAIGRHMTTILRREDVHKALVLIIVQVSGQLFRSCITDMKVI